MHIFKTGTTVSIVLGTVGGAERAWNLRKGRA